MNMFTDWKIKLDKEIRHLKWKYRILKIKWVLLFVLPILIIVFAYQVAKQFLTLRMQRIRSELIQKAPTPQKTEPDCVECGSTGSGICDRKI